MTRTAKSRSGRLEFLDFCRGIAALAVFLEHAGDHCSPEFRQFTHTWFSLGKFGVVLFFLTSGFVIPLSLEKTTVPRFWLRRFFRLYPLYWFSIGVALAAHFAGVNDILDPEFSKRILTNTLVNISMLQEFLRVPDAIGLYYTLTIELAFYAACTALVLLKWNQRARTVTWLAFAAATLCGVVAPLILHHRAPMAGLFYVLSLFVGTLIYRRSVSSINAQSLRTVLVALLGLIIVGVYLNYTLLKKANSPELFDFPAVAGPWVLGYVIFLSAYLLRSRAVPRPFLWLGRISYSVYLLHPVFIYLIPTYWPLSTALPTALASTLLVSTATFHWIEQPLIDIGRQLTIQTAKQEPRSSENHDLTEVA